MSSKTIIAGVAVAIVILVLAFTAGRWANKKRGQRWTPVITRSSATPPSPAPGFLYGRVTTLDGATYQGRLRFGGGEEAFWSDTFNGVKDENPWLAQIPPERRPKERQTLEIFGMKLGTRDRPLDVRRPFTAPFGAIARIESHGQLVRVTLKNGAVQDVGRFEASDFDDGVLVWDETRGAVNLDSLRIGTIELLPTPPLADAPLRLHGTVHTEHGDFSGFVAWNRDDGVGSDILEARTPEGGVRLRLDSVRSIASRIGDGALITLADGREVEAFGVHDDRGIDVDDPRYGHVQIPRGAFERVDFDEAGSGPAYADFAPGAPLTGRVTTRDGRQLAGRVVFDLDEHETTDTLDARAEGIDYAVPFGMVASIVRPGRVALRGGLELRLEPTGDLGEANAGMLVFAGGPAGPKYVPWSEVERVEFFDHPSAR